MLLFQEMFNYGLVSSPLIETTALEVRKLQPGSRHFSQVRKWRLKTGRDLVKIHSLRQSNGQNASLLQVQSKSNTKSNTPLKSKTPLKSDFHILYLLGRLVDFQCTRQAHVQVQKCHQGKKGNI